MSSHHPIYANFSTTTSLSGLEANGESNQGWLSTKLGDPLNLIPEEGRTTSLHWQSGGRIWIRKLLHTTTQSLSVKVTREQFLPPTIAHASRFPNWPGFFADVESTHFSARKRLKRHARILTISYWKICQPVVNSSKTQYISAWLESLQGWCEDVVYSCKWLMAWEASVEMK